MVSLRYGIADRPVEKWVRFMKNIPSVGLFSERLRRFGQCPHPLSNFYSRSALSLEILCKVCRIIRVIAQLLHIDAEVVGRLMYPRLNEAVVDDVARCNRKVPCLRPGALRDFIGLLVNGDRIFRNKPVSSDYIPEDTVNVDWQYNARRRKVNTLR